MACVKAFSRNVSKGKEKMADIECLLCMYD